MSNQTGIGEVLAKVVAERDAALKEVARVSENGRAMCAGNAQATKQLLETGKRLAEIIDLLDDAPCTCRCVDGIGNTYHDDQDATCFKTRCDAVARRQKD